MQRAHRGSDDGGCKQKTINEECKDHYGDDAARQLRGDHEEIR